MDDGIGNIQYSPICNYNYMDFFREVRYIIHALFNNELIDKYKRGELIN